jgi:hypothetical protein
MNQGTRNLVRERAGGRCEYCRLHEDHEAYYAFHLEHVTARQHEGDDGSENLAWSCHHCNLNKGPNLTAIDPETLAVVMLFHPRRDDREEHFDMQGPLIVGKSPTGRATVRRLKMNAPARIELRASI